MERHKLQHQEKSSWNKDSFASYCSLFHHNIETTRKKWKVILKLAG